MVLIADYGIAVFMPGKSTAVLVRYTKEIKP